MHVETPSYTEPARPEEGCCGLQQEACAAVRPAGAQHRSILKAAEAGPLQSLIDRELNLRERPVTIYPRPYTKVRAWVRFGPEAIRVEAVLLRSTPTAAGIGFKAEGQAFRCWAWGNAISIFDEE